MLLNFNLMRTKEISGQHIHRSHTHTHFSCSGKHQATSELTKAALFFLLSTYFSALWPTFEKIYGFRLVCCVLFVNRVSCVRPTSTFLTLCWVRHTACHTPPISTFVYGRLNLIAYNRADEQTNVKEEIRTPRRSVHRANVSSGMWLYNVSDARSL